MTEETTTPAAPDMSQFDYGHLHEDHHILARPFYALAHHLKDVLGHGKQLDDALVHLKEAHAVALPLEKLQDPAPAAPSAPVAEPDK